MISSNRGIKLANPVEGSVSTNENKTILLQATTIVFHAPRKRGENWGKNIKYFRASRADQTWRRGHKNIKTNVQYKQKNLGYGWMRLFPVWDQHSFIYSFIQTICFAVLVRALEITSTRCVRLTFMTTTSQWWQLPPVHIRVSEKEYERFNTETGCQARKIDS